MLPSANVKFIYNVSFLRGKLGGRRWLVHDLGNAQLDIAAQGTQRQTTVGNSKVKTPPTQVTT